MGLFVLHRRTRNGALLALGFLACFALIASAPGQVSSQTTTPTPATTAEPAPAATAAGAPAGTAAAAAETPVEPPAQVPTTKPFAFADATALAITPEQLAAGLPIEIVNDSTTRHSLQVRLSDLRLLGSDDKPLTDEQALQFEKTLELAPADSTVMTLRSAPGVALKPGTYSGSLIAFEPSSDTVIRRALSITIPGGVGTQEATPATEKLTINVTRHFPWEGSGYSVDGNQLPLANSAALSPEQLSLTADQPLTFLGGDAALVAISWNGQLVSVADGHAKALELDLADLERSGQYDGAVDLIADPEGLRGKVTISVAVTDLWLWPVLAVFLGIALAYAIKRYVNVRRVVDGLSQRLAEIVVTFDKAQTEFEAETTCKPFGAYEIKTTFHHLADDLQTQLAALRRPAGVELDTTKSNEATVNLGALKEVADSWSGFAAELVKLADLVAECDAAACDTTANRPKQRLGRPKVLAEADKLMKGGALDFGKYKELRADVGKRQTLLASWRSMLDSLRFYQQRIEELRKESDGKGHETELAEAEAELNGVENELWSAATSEDFTRFETSKDLLGVEATLSRFVILPPDDDGMVAAVESLTAVDGGIAVPGGVWAEPGRAEAPPVDWAALGSKLRTQRQTLDLAVTAVSLLLALVAAMTTLYIGKQFGGVSDYLGAFVWALATDGVLTVLLAAVSRFGGVNVAPAATPPELAKTPSSQTSVASAAPPVASN